MEIDHDLQFFLDYIEQKLLPNRKPMVTKSIDVDSGFNFIRER